MREDDLIDKIDRLQESIDLNNNLMIEFNDRLASIQESVSNKRGEDGRQGDNKQHYRGPHGPVNHKTTIIWKTKRKLIKN